MKLYGRGASRSFRAVWALKEASLDFEYESTQLLDDVTEEYLTLNSQGKVPTLVDGDLVLTESAAILNYVGRKAADSTLMPQDAMEQAQYDEVCFFIMAELEQPLWTLVKHRFALPEPYRRDVADTAGFEFEKAQRALSFILRNRSYAATDRFTMADVLLAQTLSWAESSGQSVSTELLQYKNLQYDRAACKEAQVLIEEQG